MITFVKKSIALSTILAVLISVETGCGANAKSNSKMLSSSDSASVSSISGTTSSKSSSSASNVSNTDTLSTAKPTAASINTLKLDAFYPINKAVAATLYENISNTRQSKRISGSFDFNADGKKESIKIDYSSDGAKKSTITVGSASVKQSLIGLAGVYAVTLNKSDSKKVLAIVDYELDNDITTYFYRYDAGKLTLIGDVPGCFVLDKRAGYYIPEYNDQILVDGNGHIIPRFGLMKYVSPSILLKAYKLTDNELTSMSIDLNGTKNGIYKLSMNIKPYFEKGNSNINHTLQYNDHNKISLSKGDTITVLDVSTSDCANVKLSSGKQGLLYFFLHP